MFGPQFQGQSLELSSSPTPNPQDGSLLFKTYLQGGWHSGSASEATACDADPQKRRFESRWFHFPADALGSLEGEAGAEA